jgi:outer membrane protein insertion porin family
MTISMWASKLFSVSGKSGPRFPAHLFLILLLSFLLLPGAEGVLSSSVALAEQTSAGVEISFAGNQELSVRVLREAASYELDRFMKMGFRRADVDDAAFRMELAYRERGYAFAVVDYNYETVEGLVLVSFLIFEGPRVRIETIRINGNRAFSNNQLRAFFREDRNSPLTDGDTYYVGAKIDDAIAGIRDLYFMAGYLEARIDEPRIDFSADRRLATITINISEGPQYLVREISFQGDIHPEVERELAQIREELLNQPFNRQVELELRSSIREAYGNLGYPEVRAEVLQNQLEQPSQVLLEAIIASGPLIRISEIIISGNRETRDSFIRNRVLIEPGDLYRVADQRQSFRRLYQTGLFSRVSLSLAPGPDEEHRVLHVEVEELPSRELSVETGWGSYELLRGSLGYLDRNPFGTGRTFRAELGGSYRGAHLTASILDPWFLRRDITAHLPIFLTYREEPAFTRREIGSTLLFTKELTRDLAVSLGYTFRNTLLTDIDLDALQEDFSNSYNLGSLRSRISYITQNDLFFPTDGQESYLAGEVADTFLGSEIAFYRITAGTYHYFSLGRSTILALRYETGFTIPTRGQDSLPPAERFYTGGENTVRSFRQDQVGLRDAAGDPLGGLAFNVFSAEIRQQLRGPLIGTLFLDYGNISPNTENLFGIDRSELISATFSEYFRDLRPAVGLGFQYLLPFGPIRLDTAFNPVAREGEREYTIHFSVGMAF